MRGGWLSSAALRGRPYALTFLYTNCPDVCPLIGQELRQSLELLEREADRVAVAAVSVDPEGDTAEAVRLWLRRMRLPANFHYLIGTQTELRPLWKAYFAAPQQPNVEQSLHTASIWLIDARGRWRTKFSGGVPVAPTEPRARPAPPAERERPLKRTTVTACRDGAAAALVESGEGLSRAASGARRLPSARR